MKAHRNIPFFVPHAGCPNCCVFCSQTKITGQTCEKELSREICELKNLLDSVSLGDSQNQIGFFGGSFTAIDKTRMEKLLSVANEYIDKGVVESIRISTRPDKIDQEILDILKKYGVTNIELGVQSTCDKVLTASNRGHIALDSFKASELITKNGFVFGGQMMIGLPQATMETEIQTALDIVKMGAKEARIYPTVVFEGTKLFDMAKSGEYTPLELEDAVERTAKCYKIFLDANIKLLRIGLHSSENLANAPLGANHPAIGELVISRVYTDMVLEKCGNVQGKILEIGINKKDISTLLGHNRKGINRIINQTGASKVNIYPCDAPRFSPFINIRSV